MVFVNANDKITRYPMFISYLSKSIVEGKTISL